MSELMKTVLSLSCSGTLLMLLILGLKQLYRNKCSRRWQYYIWLIAALRFLIPFTPDTTIVGSLFEMFEPSAITNETPTDPNIPANAGTDNTDSIEVEDKQAQENNTITAATAHTPPGIYPCLFIVWTAAALIVFIRRITLYQGFIRHIRADSTAVSDIKILNLLSDCEEKLHIRTRAELYHNALITSPMMTGFFRPCIVLPVREWEEQDLSHVFMHELVHYRQRDMFYKWLVQIVVCIHWFNPFVYLLEKESNQSCELSCDETVISMLDDTARRAYGDMLISFMKSDHLCSNASASITLTEGAEQLKERLGAIMKYEKKSKSVIAFTAILTAAVCFFFFTAGAYAAPSTDSGTENLVPVTARTMESGSTYTYVHRSFYSDSYIIGMGWNLNDTIMSKEHYTDGREITLADNSTISVYFGELFFGDADGNATEYLDDSNAVRAIGNLISSLKSNNLPNYPPIETPLVTNITYVGEDLPALAEQYFESSDATAFSAIFPVLAPRLQTEYCKRIYDADKTALFSAVIPYMDREFIMLYAEQADQDMKSNFFYAVVPYMTSDELNQYAEKYYETNDLSRFAAIAFYLTELQKQDWLLKAQTDNKNTFSAFLSANLLK